MSNKRIPMFIRSPHRSKVFIGLSMFSVVMFIALSAMRVGNTEAQQSVGGFLPPPQLAPLLPPQIQTSAPQQQPRTFPTANDGFVLPPGVYGLPPDSRNYRQHNPTGTQFAAPPNGVYSNNLANVFPGAMPTAAPMTESDRRALELANRIRQTRDNDEREQLRNQLRETLNAAFDQRREQQLQEMEQLERQLDSIRKLDEKRQQRKEEIVQRRISDLLSEPDALDWEPKRLEGQYGFPGPMPGSLPPGGLQPPRVSGFQASGQNQDNNLQLDLPGAPRFPSVDPNNPSEKADATTKPQLARDAFTYQLTDSIMENIGRLRRQREHVKDLFGLNDQQSANFSAVDARLLSSIENGRSIWLRIGKQKERDVDSATVALDLAKQRLKIKQAANAKGNLARFNLMDDEAAVVLANANVATAQDQLDVWKEIDQRLRTALNEVGLSDPEQKAADEAVEKNVEEAVEKQEDNGPDDASVEQGATRHRLFYDLRFCCRVTIWQTMASKA